MKLIINIKPEAKLSRIEALTKTLGLLKHSTGLADNLLGTPYYDVIESTTCDKAVN